jgi:hypothetical protein
MKECERTYNIMSLLCISLKWDATKIPPLENTKKRRKNSTKKSINAKSSYRRRLHNLHSPGLIQGSFVAFDGCAQEFNTTLIIVGNVHKHATLVPKNVE